MERERERDWDAVRGILIILVVMGHYQEDVVHDIIFLFHMPLYFMLAGYFCRDGERLTVAYVSKKVWRLLVPCVSYFCVQNALERSFSVKNVLKFLWGGRLLPGVYWYMTCLFLTLLLFTWMREHFSARLVRVLALLGGAAAVLESHVAAHVPLLKRPGVPWDADVCLLALLYVAIGFYGREQLTKWMRSENSRYDILACAAAVLLGAFCWVCYRMQRFSYAFDMKIVHYRALVPAVVLPVLFGIVLLRAVRWACRIAMVSDVLTFLSRTSVPILFLHMPLHTVIGTDCGRLTYMAAGLAIPCAWYAVCRQSRRMCRWFGVPERRTPRAVHRLKRN